MKLAEMTWQDVAEISRDTVVVVPTGSLEQHGPHLPLFTDSLLVTGVVNAVEAQVPESCLVTPTVWLGASGHHLGFQGSLTNTFEAYQEGIAQIVECLLPYGFNRYYLVNGHGGNTSPNDVVCRKLRMKHVGLTIGHTGYFSFLSDSLLEEVMEGRVKGIRHACEAEASLMMHLHPELVRTEKLRDDGLHTEPPVPGVVWHFDEVTQEGSLGQATLATAEKGRRLFEAAVEGVMGAVQALREGVVLVGDGD